MTAMLLCAFTGTVAGCTSACSHMSSKVDLA